MSSTLLARLWPGLLGGCKSGAETSTTLAGLLDPDSVIVDCVGVEDVEEEAVAPLDSVRRVPRR